MSRAQQGQTFRQTQGESKQSYGNAENDLTMANRDVGAFQTDVDKLSAANPYNAGGEYQSAQNMVLANTADAMAQAAGARLQTQAERTGQNPAGAIAATEAMQADNERTLAGQEAEATNRRIDRGAAYNQDVTNMKGRVPALQAEVAGQEAGLYGKALGVQEDAAKTPSFLETLESQLADAGGKVAAAYAGKSKG